MRGSGETSAATPCNGSVVGETLCVCVCVCLCVCVCVCVCARVWGCGTSVSTFLLKT